VLKNIIITVIIGISFLSCRKDTTTFPINNIPDTTSHSFVWEIDTLGYYPTTFLDVALLDENDIWAVGEIYLKDSTGMIDPVLYNAAHWNGIKWDVMRIYYKYQGQNTIGVINSVFAFNENDIWFGTANMIHYDGYKFQEVSTQPAFPASMHKIWGSSSNNLYIVGTDGKIAHYDGTNWTGIESGTMLPFQDIWGAVNSKTGELQILAIASDKFGLGGEYLVQLKDNTAIHINNNFTQNVSLSSIWFTPDHEYYMTGGDILLKQKLTDSLWQFNPRSDMATTYVFSIRGSAQNDIVLVGDRGEISHYNGASWRQYKELYNIPDQLLRVDIKGNMIVAVGSRLGDFYSDHGLIYIGRR
jgi:hypothetical protein